MTSRLSSPSPTAHCGVCGGNVHARELFPGASLRPALLPFVRDRAPEWKPEDGLCLSCLNRVRADFVEQSLFAEKKELTEAEKEVLEALRKHEPVSTPPESIEENSDFGARLSDRIASVGGSWTFIIGFSLVLVAWILANTFVMAKDAAFDPYPYILLNLVLSCLAALQAPIIMMSQNRQAQKDRLQAEADYKTNLKAELEIRHLHIKIDQLVSHQWHKLLEIQQVQRDLMEDSVRLSKGKKT